MNIERVEEIKNKMPRLHSSFINRATAAALLALIALTSLPAHAFYRSSPDESDLDNHGHYVNHDGQSVHSPAHSRSGRIPAGATAQCRDGSYSFSQHHSGTCSRHGGVAEWE